MSTQDPLIVPVEVSAMVLNSPAVNLLRAGMDYDRLSTYQSPSPGAFANTAVDFAADPRNRGVYVMWTLPRALRRRGKDGFPFAPDRWLVVRLFRAKPPANAAPQATPPAVAVWMVEGDYLDPHAATSAFVDPTVVSQLTPTRVGRKVAITADAPWREPADPPPYFLRAVAEANPAFAAFQPFNQNVFSMFDNLESQGLEAGTLSYYVVGWYSRPEADILASGTDEHFADKLSDLKWSVDTTAGHGSHVSIYQGAAFGVPWTPGGLPPPSPKDGARPQVAIGNSSMDAVVAFARAAFHDAEKSLGGLTPQDAADLINAFEYNMLAMLGQPGAEAMLEQQIRSQWFGSSQAGTSWTIVDAERSHDATPPEPDPAERVAEATWLAALNTAQTRYDSLTRELIGPQRDLFTLWWKQNAARIYLQQSGSADWPWGTSSDQFSAAMPPAITSVRGLNEALAGLLPDIPLATPTITLADAVAAFASARKLSATRVLKPASRPRFWLQGEPVAVLSDTQGLLRLDPDAVLACRWPDALVTQLRLPLQPGGGAGGFTVTATQLAALLPALNWTNLPDLAKSLFAELFLLDPANADLLAAIAGQTLSAQQSAALAISMSPPEVPPASGVAPAILPKFPWRQPWLPLYLDWEIEWFPIPFQQPGGAPNWAFNGLDFDLTPGFSPSPVNQLISGRTVLTPKPSYEFKARVDQFIKEYPDNVLSKQLQGVEDLVETVDGWGFLSQSLSGLTSLFAGWNPTPVQLPDNTPLPDGGTLRSLIGDQAQMSLNPTMAATPRDPTPPPSSFEGLRCGQFYLNRLTIIDAFGQTLEIVEAPVAPDQFPRTFDNFVFQPLVADGLTPTKPLGSQEPQRFVQLPPRLLQPARLNLDFQLKENGSPIIGWILPNHLDSGIAVYGPDGSALGTLRLGVDAAGVPVATWDAAPHSSWPMLPDPSEDLPDFQNFVATLRSQGAAALRDFLKSVDESLWTVDPLGGPTDSFLSILIGRPLAVVSAALSFELLADPLRDVNWPYTFTAPPPLFLGYKFPVRLGDLGYRQDGLIGYFAARDFTRFNCIHLPQPGPGDPPLSPYLKAIAPDNYVNIGFADRGPGPAANLVLLMDPRAGVHAQCGLLPVKQATLLPAWVDSALNAMVATFRTGPALVSQQPAAPRDNGQAPGGDPATALLLPRFAQLRGDLTWLERNGDGDWSEMALAPIDGSARLAATPPTLREGLLKLSLNK